MAWIDTYWKAIRKFWRAKHITKIIIFLILLMILFTMLFFAFIALRANVQSLKDGLSESTIIYDKDGDVASKVGTNRSEGVNINNLPDYVGQAVIAIEDQRFYEHNGFDAKGITRAFFNNLFAGRVTGGGSTVTQQLTKNALLSPTRSYRRKVEELFLAVEIEKHYKKDEILQMYLNQVYFGSGTWGINQAASKYFNKTANELTISESAMLAGVLQAPSALNPYNNYDAALNRRNVVLAKMHELKMISTSQYKTAKNEQLNLHDGGGSYIERKYPYYVDAVLDEAIQKYGLTQEEILTRGYKIFTAMDQNVQSSLEKVYDRDSLFPKGKNDVLVQSGAVLMDPQTGGVRGLVGGRGEYVFRGFNRATHLKAQPGSTLKPIAVYTPAIEEGYTVSSILKDEKLTFGDYQPQNATKTYGGDVTMYKALQDSLNVPAVWLLNEIGLDKGLNSIKRFGIPLEKEDEYLGIALGGMHKGISPLQLAQAYTVFPNGGKRSEGHLITKIVGPTGNVLFEFDEKLTKVTSKGTAKEITSMLLNVVEAGTGKGAKISGIQLAGKTGSTQLPYGDIEGTKDQWFVGYTPNLVGAVWLGYDQTNREHYLPNSTSKTVVPLFKALMEQILPHVETETFSIESVNTRLSESEKQDEVKQEMKETVNHIQEKLKQNAPEWKEKLDNGLLKIMGKAQQLIEEIKTKIGD